MRAGSLLWTILAASLVATAVSAQKRHPPARPIDLNSATAAELQQIPGIGPRRAAAIVEFRQKSGPFRRVEDLLAIRGFSTRMVQKIKPYVVVGPPSEKGKEGKSTPPLKPVPAPHL